MLPLSDNLSQDENKEERRRQQEMSQKGFGVTRICEKGFFQTKSLFCQFLNALKINQGAIGKVSLLK